jgi:triphosphoribosyl-dephospho-CoA synthase
LPLRKSQVGNYVASCAQLSILLEVSAYPKPGNVHRLHDFLTTRYEHFLAGSVAVSPSINRLAQSGFDVKAGHKTWEELRLGNCVYSAIKDSFKWQSGGNVNLGIVLLFAPIAAAAGYILKDEIIQVDDLIRVANEVMKSTTPKDAVSVYRSIRYSMTDKVLGSVSDLDVSERSSLKQILRDKISLYEIFIKCAERDTICNEWISGYNITAKKSYPYLLKAIKSSCNINTATIDTFLYVLSENPDSLIVRKNDLTTAKHVSDRAREILDHGGYSSDKGRRLTEMLDLDLQGTNGLLNPGTTADLTAASLFILFLNGWRY